MFDNVLNYPKGLFLSPTVALGLHLYATHPEIVESLPLMVWVIY